MKFDYLKLPAADPRRKWISRPIIPVRIIGPVGNWEGLALIDSGADRSLFHFEIGEIIGIDIKKGELEYFSGIEGKRITTYLHSVKLQVMGLEKNAIEIAAGFTNSPGVSAILGQDGFFDSFRIKFERDIFRIEISPAKKWNSFN